MVNMAKILFMLKNIIYFFQSEKVLSVFILLGMVVCDAIFLVFGNVYWSDAKNNAYEIEKNNVVIFQFDALDFDALDMDKFLEMTECREYVTSTFFRFTELDAENHPVTISAYNPPFDAAGQRIKLGHGLAGNDGECVVSSQYLQREGFALPGSVIGRVFHFLDIDWICTGIISPSMADDFDLLINMADFKARIKNRENQIIAGFRYKQGASLVEVHQFADDLKEEFHADFAAVPSRTVGVGFGEFLSDMSEMLVLLVIAIVNYMFLYRFLLEKRMYAYGIYKLYGMDNCLTLVGLFVEMLIFLVVTFGFSLLLYFCGIALFGQIGMVMQHAQEFWFSFVMISVINLFFFGLAAVKAIRSSPAELIRESVVG